MICNINNVPCSTFDIKGNACGAFDINGNNLTFESTMNEYERCVWNARNEWLAEAKADKTITPVIVHADQHGRLQANNSLFKFIGEMVPWVDTSACIGLGDTSDYNVTSFQNMEKCLSKIPKDKQINIWGNHDTWTRNWYNNISVPTVEEMNILRQYFNNSFYTGYKKYNDFGIERMIDYERKIKYIVLGGWEYDINIGYHSHYVISSQGMESIIQMLSEVDDYDIVILSHIQPFANQKVGDWKHPPVEDGNVQGGAGGMNIGVGNVTDTNISQMLYDRQNGKSGVVIDSYKNQHAYDFSKCTSKILCCFAGHEHCDKYMWQNGDIPVYLFDAYAYDKNPFYFVNIDKTKKRLNIWKVDNTPHVYNFQIPILETKQ